MRNDKRTDVTQLNINLIKTYCMPGYNEMNESIIIIFM